MRDNPEPRTADDRLRTPASHADTPTRALIARLRADPVLWVPFFLAGCVLAVVDSLRNWDPLPVVSPLGESTITVSYAIYPTGTTATSRPFGALVDLQLPTYAYALSLEGLVIVTVAVAGWFTMVRASDEPFQPRRFLVYLSGVFLIDILSRLADTVGLEYTGGSLLIGISILVLTAIVSVRLFFLPVIVLREDGIVSPLSASWRYSQGHGWTVFAVILFVGIGSWVLAHVPTLGTVLSVTIAGTVHAVSLVVLYRRYVENDGGNRHVLRGS